MRCLFLRLIYQMLTIKKLSKLRSLQGVLAHTPIGKKLSIEEVIKKAGRKEAKRIAGK